MKINNNIIKVNILIVRVKELDSAIFFLFKPKPKIPSEAIQKVSLRAKDKLIVYFFFIIVLSFPLQPAGSALLY